MKIAKLIPFFFWTAGVVLLIGAKMTSGCLLAVGLVSRSGWLSFDCDMIFWGSAIVLLFIGVAWWALAQVMEKKRAKRI